MFVAHNWIKLWAYPPTLNSCVVVWLKLLPFLLLSSCSFTFPWFVFPAKFKGQLMWAGPLTTSICRESLSVGLSYMGLWFGGCSGLIYGRIPVSEGVAVVFEAFVVLWRVWCKALPGCCVIKAWSYSWGRMDWEKVLQSLFVKGEIWKKKINWKIKIPRKKFYFFHPVLSHSMQLLFAWEVL